MLYLIFSNLHFWHSNCIMVCNYDLFCLFFIIGPPSRVAFFLSQLFDDVKSKKKTAASIAAGVELSFSERFFVLFK